MSSALQGKSGNIFGSQYTFNKTIYSKILYMIKIATAAAIAICTLSGTAHAQSKTCVNIANMARDIAGLRDMGIPMSAVHARLRTAVSDPREVELGMSVAELVYNSRDNGEDIRAATLKMCRQTRK